MIEVRYGDRFLRRARHLSSVQQERLANLISFLTRNPFDPKLHTKPLTGELTGFYAFRLGRDWRVIFQFVTPEIVYLFDVGHRSEIYR